MANDETNEQHPDVQALQAVWATYARDLTEGFHRFGQALADGMRPIVREVTEAMGVLVEAYRSGYEAAGAPYGPGDEAMWRWWHDIAEARHRQQADLDQRLRVWSAADFARQIHTPQLPVLPVPQAQPLARFVSPDVLAALMRPQVVDVVDTVSEKGDADGE